MTIKPLLPLAVLAASSLLLAASASAQVSFSLSDGVGTPTSGTYPAGSTFSLAVTFNTPTASSGYSLWFDTATANANRFSIGGFTLTSTSFPDPQSANGAQSFNTAENRAGFLSNLNDLGATTAAGTTVPAGSYGVENVSFLIDANTPAGTYTLETTPAAAGGRASGGVDDAFNFVNAPSATYTVTVVPEPSSYLLLGGGALGLVAAGMRRRRALTSRA